MLHRPPPLIRILRPPSGVPSINTTEHPERAAVRAARRPAAPAPITATRRGGVGEEATGLPSSESEHGGGAHLGWAKVGVSGWARKRPEAGVDPEGPVWPTGPRSLYSHTGLLYPMRLFSLRLPGISVRLSHRRDRRVVPSQDREHASKDSPPAYGPEKEGSLPCRRSRQRGPA